MAVEGLCTRLVGIRPTGTNGSGFAHGAMSGFLPVLTHQVYYGLELANFPDDGDPAVGKRRWLKVLKN